MATYNMGQWRYNPQKKARQRISVISRVLDLTLPPYATHPKNGTTAWARNDVIQLIGMRADQTVLGVQVEVLNRCTASASARIAIGYGSDTDRWGVYAINKATGVIDPTSDYKEEGVASEFAPFRFTASDTIDVLIYSGTPTDGKIKISVIVMEDDRR